MKYSNKIQVREVKYVIEQAVSAHDEYVWTTAIMPHSYMYSTA